MKSKKMSLKWILPLFFLVFQAVSGQTVFGKWRTVDDRSGIAKAIVHIYNENGLLQAKIVQVLEKGKEDAICTKCDDEFKNKPILGMHIFQDLEKNHKDEYKGNKMLDPEHGMKFRGKLWLDPDNDNQLKVRGYLAFLYRTQTWYRVKEE
ncbi:DUF2147 domain-containing protein [Muricauda sp. CAU 1633]|uniref:DUF2147 domain-containing protein n=1 Tax=Allomuricauda sp. CAU 1633 TaxID=2816036 RepID=UPI001A8E19E1|nr:DUF2147 domain-containing protein [Muricauda sp. CAU 1633]MBO0322465.1 DUF2147 domain-containing protein [Muricauda sp. CAU 1633]